MAGKPGSGLSDKEAAFLAAAQRELAARKAGVPVEKPAAVATPPRTAAATVPPAPASPTPGVQARAAAQAPAPVPSPVVAPTAAPEATPSSAPDAPAQARGALPESAAQRLAALMAQEAEENARRKKRMRVWTTHVPVGLLVVLIGWVLTMLANLLKRNTF